MSIANRDLIILTYIVIIRLKINPLYTTKIYIEIRSERDEDKPVTIAGIEIRFIL
jgi:hypothetical protein